MFGIDDATAVAAMPTPEAAGTPGYFTEGNPGLGQAATYVRASFLNGLQLELLNILAAASITPSKTTYTQLLGAMLKIGGRASRVRGLTGANNASTPLTQYDVSAAAVDFREAATGVGASVTTVGTITNNIATAGPAVNARDQAAAFTASTWVHFYFIFNPTTATVATISSASAPPTGPTLPSGYTAWAYIGAVVLNASTQLTSVKFRGAWATYDTPAAILSGSATTLTAFSTAALVPPNALEYKPLISNFAFSATAGGAYSRTLFLDSYQVGISGTGGASAVVSCSGGSCLIPNVGQSSSYRIDIASGSGPTTTVQVQGYKMPNGGE